MARKSRGSPYTVQHPVELPAVRDGQHWRLEAGDRSLRLSNLDKVYWPRDGYTKGDLLSYYYGIADFILPYLAQRPLTRKRMPEGAEGPFFYEKNAPVHTPDWMPRCKVASDEGGGVNDFLMAQDVASLLYVVNLGSIEFHPLHSRCATIELPDYLFFDLDPMGDATFSDVRAVAHHVRAALDALGLVCYPKTSGATGMQIYVPLIHGPSYDQTRDFVGAVGRAILRADRSRVTMEWDISKRGDKIFIDHNMNRRGQNIASVYSARPERGATVSMPLTWEQVEAGASPADFTILNGRERAAQVDHLFRPVLEAPVDLRPAMERLGMAADFELTGRPPQAEAGERSLDEYARKRNFAATPEPAGSSEPPDGNRFVIQKHDATRLHYDLRLERSGVYVSWAVPKGLPTVPGQRHLAVQTEDHPLDYGGFEGWIPEGNYGAGEVRIFDRGTYDTLEWEPGKIMIRLHGARHRGEYHMVRTAQGWLVMLSKRSAQLQPDPPPEFSPMLAEAGHKPFDDDEWRFEPKLDGIRTLAYVTPEGTRLVSRTGRDQTHIYPELASLAQFVNALSAVVDGEIVASDDSGRPSFERLQQRMNLTGSADIQRMRKTVPVTLFAFDLLWLDGRSLLAEPVEERRRLLEGVATETGRLRLTLHRDGQGKSMFAAVKAMGLEGMIAKRLGSPYLPGQRSRDWRKVKALKRTSCVVLGWTCGSGSRSTTFGSLLVGAHEDGRLVWLGQVGTGFTEPVLKDLLAKLVQLETGEPAAGDPALAALKGGRWVRPELVCDVEYLQLTAGRKLRAPSFKGLRPDKSPADCTVEEAAG